MATHSNPERSHGQRTLVGYNPRGCKELTEHACMHIVLWTKCLCFPPNSYISESVNHLVVSDSLGPPGSSVHGIFQARILEWGAVLFFRGRT